MGEAEEGADDLRGQPVRPGERREEKLSGLEILKDLFFIERGYLNGNHFLYRGERPVLIDTGYIADFARTEELLTRLGVDPARVGLIINTHTHCDHVGGNRFIQERSGCEIALHHIGKHFIETRDDWATWWRYYNQAAEFFECTRGLKDGEVVAVGAHEFEVLDTPGHAADGIVLYNRRARVLISSDTLWEDDVATMTLRVEGSRALFSHLDSLERLAGLEIERVYPGHGPPFTGVKEALAKARRRCREYLTNPQRLGNDLLKKILIYTLLMHRGVQEAGFLEHLKGTPWFKETVDLYFEGAYQAKYEEIMEGLLKRGLVKREGGQLLSTVRP